MKNRFLFAFLFAFSAVAFAQHQSAYSTYIMDTGDTMTVSNNPTPAANNNNPNQPLACASTNNLILPYNTNNGQRGIMFDITALSNITINCFDVNMATGTTNVEIYYKVGTHVGFTTTPGAWTLIGSASVAGLGTNLATYVPVSVNVAVTAGCTVAFYITRTTAGGPIVNYTNGTAVGFVFASNADLQVKDGTGKDYPFAASFTPRRFNGTIYYTLNSAASGGTITGPLTLCAGATASYTYNGNGWTSFAWTVPAGTTITSGQGTATITIVAGSTPGNICCTPSSACGPGPQTCIAVTLAPSPTSTQTSTNVSCNGGNNGSATITPNPAGAYTYVWSPNVSVAQTASSLPAGTYTVTASNSGGCTTTQTITITQPTPITTTASHVDLQCNSVNNGSATVNPSGGAGGYTYSWSPAGGNSATASNLSAQNYTCTITDASGCAITQTFTITSPSAMTLTTSATPSVCGSPNGTATVNAAGGAGGYTYSWSPTGGNGATASGLNGGSYVVTVTDANGCISTATVNVVGASTPTVTVTASANILCNGNSTGSATVTPSGGNGPYTYSWSPSGGTNATANNLSAGSYTCTLTDANGCTSTDSVTLTEPPLLTASLTSVDILCNGGNSGSATVTAAGGNPAYIYSWSPSGGNAASANNLSAQSYTCTLTDANGCSTTSSVTITEPTALTTTASQIDELCSGGNTGSATVNPSGGVPGYIYSWSPSGGNAATAPNLTAQSYTCTITDANGCIITQTFTITAPATVVASSGALTNVFCNGQSTGVINVNQAGGVGPYSYTWTPNVSASNSASNIAAGSYQVMVTDANGCSSTVTIVITEPPVLTVQTTVAPTAICSGQNAVLTANSGGGVPAYTVNWSPGNLSGSSQNITPATTTTYTAVVTDANGCTASNSVTITVNPVPVANFTSDVVAGCVPVCVNFSDQSTIANPGVISAWTWDFGDSNTSTSQSPLHCYTTSGNYTIIFTVKSVDGCQNTVTITNYISVSPIPVADFSSSPQPTTILNPQIYFTDLSTGANSWNWSFGDVNQSASSLENPSFEYGSPDCFTVLLTVQNQQGCTDTISHPVCIDSDVTIYVPNAFTPNGDGNNEIFYPVCTGIDPAKFQMWIFDRWGNMIYSTTDYAKGWDGKVQGHSDISQEDTYVWKLVTTDMNGATHSLIGSVNLIK
ncbi:MAG: gliding motility-associated C-terminal domain-containing protein [Bacteroidetes bacterium]|nr:gliding motility-associated C-terminal domain-containing protein [Bacteroidota bacterium]